MAYIEIYKRCLVIPKLHEFLSKVYSLIFGGCGSIVEPNQKKQEIRVDFRGRRGFFSFKKYLLKN